MTPLKSLLLSIYLIFYFSISVFPQTVESSQSVQQNANNPVTNPPHALTDSQIESRKLVVQAKELNNAGKYQECKKILERAIELDPNNEEAKNMLVNLNEVLALEERQRLEQQRQVQQNTATERRNTETANHYGFKIGFDIPFVYSKSDKQNLYDSKVWGLGAGTYIDYFPIHPSLKNILGFRLDYTSMFLRFKSSFPKYFLNIINFNAIARFKLSKRKNGAEIAGYIGYRYFSLNNHSKYDFPLEGVSQGLYSYTSLLGFTFGFYFKDSLFYYLFKTKSSEKIILFIKFDILPAFKSGNPNVFFVCGGFEIILNEKFALDIKASRFIIKSKIIEENFTFFSVGFSYNF